MRTARAANAALWAIIVILTVLTLAIAVLPLVRGWQAVALTGQSMTGTYDMGSLVYVDPRVEARINSVITFDHGGRLWTHRIVAETHARESFDIVRWQTKGDNPNLSNDPFLVAPEDIRGVVVESVPFIGYADLYLKQPLGWLTLAIVALLLSWLSKQESPTQRRLREVRDMDIPREEPHEPTAESRDEALLREQEELHSHAEAARSRLDADYSGNSAP